MSSILIGLSWIFGPDEKHSSAIFSVWNQLGISWQLTGLWALVSGLLIVAPLPGWTPRIVGYAMGFVFRATFAGYGLAAYFTSGTTGVTGFTDWATLAMLHAVVGLAVVRARYEPSLRDVQEAIRRKSGD